MNNITLHKAHEGMEGAGVSVNRLFPIAGKMNHDPFVLWDHFDIPPSAGFPEHPHRGFEAITYVMQGTIAVSIGKQGKIMRILDVMLNVFVYFCF